MRGFILLLLSLGAAASGAILLSRPQWIHFDLDSPHDHLAAMCFIGAAVLLVGACLVGSINTAVRRMEARLVAVKHPNPSAEPAVSPPQQASLVEQIAAAQSVQPLYYATPQQRPQVQTIEMTSKGLKGLMFGSMAIFVFATVIAVSNEGGSAARTIGVLIAIVSLLVWLFARFEAWWQHG